MEHIISDFKIGDKVYHISQQELLSKTCMIVVYVNKNLNVVHCRWITPKGKKQFAEFSPIELDFLR